MGAFTIGALSMIGVPPTAGFVSKWYILAGSLQAENLLAVFTIIGSTVLNAAYFLPIIFMAWFEREPEGARAHGEAPPLIVLAVVATALLTLGFFFFNSSVIELEKQLVQGMAQ